MLICVDECMYDHRQNLFSRVEHLQNSITTRAKQTFETYDTSDASSLRLQTATHKMKSWRYPISGFATVTCDITIQNFAGSITWLINDISFR